MARKIIYAFLGLILIEFLGGIIVIIIWPNVSDSAGRIALLLFAVIGILAGVSFAKFLDKKLATHSFFDAKDQKWAYHFWWISIMVFLIIIIVFYVHCYLAGTSCLSSNGYPPFGFGALP